jgi:hypothetical protein
MTECFYMIIARFSDRLNMIMQVETRIQFDTKCFNVRRECNIRASDINRVERLKVTRPLSSAKEDTIRFISVSASQFCENQAWTASRQDSILEIVSTKFDGKVQQRVECHLQIFDVECQNQ